jgi:hypothetical protein
MKKTLWAVLLAVAVLPVFPSTGVAATPQQYQGSSAGRDASGQFGYELLRSPKMTAWDSHTLGWWRARSADSLDRYQGFAAEQQRELYSRRGLVLASFDGQWRVFPIFTLPFRSRAPASAPTAALSMRSGPGTHYPMLAAR